MIAWTGISLAPTVAPWLLGLIGVAIILTLVYGLIRRARGLGWRALVMAVLLLVLGNPSLDREERRVLPDVAVIVEDASPSQVAVGRHVETTRAVETLRAALAGEPDVEVRVARVEGAAPSEDGGAPRSGTFAFGALHRALADVPADSVAGVILVTDGQIHDAPTPLALGIDAPVHALITGHPGEIDRRIVVEQAPSYGLVGSALEIAVRIEDSGPGGDDTPVALSVALDDGEPRTELVRPGETVNLPVALDHAGATIVSLAAAERAGELSTANNRAVVAINGVRERLRVLLVSGEAHTGERVWRSLLKADPGVDLVHFTILRPPEKQDGTPIRELALISFPVRELFEVKLQDFDLIIFDRYRRRGIIPQGYLQNIADFVEEGGALFVAAGPEFASPLSLYRTPLGVLMPGRPSGEIIEAGYRPALTEVGKRHPVTNELAGAAPDDPHWGRWFRTVDVEVGRGETLMTGAGGRPLLLLDHVGQGRVAQLLSDESWLWSRGFEGGGPQSELLRRTAHWLMKEPELDESALRAEARGDRLVVSRQSIEAEPATVEIVGPSGETATLALEDRGRGRAVGELAVEQPGLYRVSDGERVALAAVGEINPREWLDLRATDAILRPLAEATGGGVAWLAVDGVPALRRVEKEHDAAGRGWFGLTRTRRYLVIGVEQFTLIPPALALVLALGGLALAWRAEGR